MIDADSLLVVARELVSKPHSGRPKQARLRRAESTAYYAVLHVLMREIANEFVGARQARSEAWLNAYRYLDHADIRRSAQKTTAFGPEIREFIRLIGELQARRLSADYDPSARFALKDTLLAIEKASNAIDAIGKADPSSKRAFLASLIFNKSRK